LSKATIYKAIFYPSFQMINLQQAFLFISIKITIFRVDKYPIIQVKLPMLSMPALLAQKIGV